MADGIKNFNGKEYSAETVQSWLEAFNRGELPKDWIPGEPTPPCTLDELTTALTTLPDCVSPHDRVLLVQQASMLNMTPEEYLTSIVHDAVARQQSADSQQPSNSG